MSREVATKNLADSLTAIKKHLRAARALRNAAPAAGHVRIVIEGDIAQIEREKALVEADLVRIQRLSPYTDSAGTFYVTVAANAAQRAATFLLQAGRAAERAASVQALETQRRLESPSTGKRKHKKKPKPAGWETKWHKSSRSRYGRFTTRKPSVGVEPPPTSGKPA